MLSIRKVRNREGKHNLCTVLIRKAAVRSVA